MLHAGGISATEPPIDSLAPSKQNALRPQPTTTPGGPHIAATQWVRALTVTPWTERALDRLSVIAESATPDAKPRVLAVFDRSCYAGLGPDLLFCFGHPEIGRAPLNLLVDLPAGTNFEKLGVQKGGAFGKDGGALRLGPLRILLAGAKSWTPPRPIIQATDAKAFDGRLKTLANVVKSYENPPGLGSLARPALSGRATASLPPLAARALPYVRHFSEGLDKGDAALLRKGAKGLVGLGPGLTPAGDDLLGGWLTSLRSAEGWGFSRRELDRAAAEVRALAAGKTSLISEALLRCAVAGASSESIHNLLNLVLGEPRPEGAAFLARAVLGLSRRGHSSGWDALAGICWGLRSLSLRLNRMETRLEFPSSRSPAFESHAGF
ncbi:MAG: DUF2877 domain-containing protein [Nitrospinota bacterium]